MFETPFTKVWDQVECSILTKLDAQFYFLPSLSPITSFTEDGTLRTGLQILLRYLVLGPIRYSFSMRPSEWSKNRKLFLDQANHSTEADLEQMDRSLRPTATEPDRLVIRLTGRPFASI